MKRAFEQREEAILNSIDGIQPAGVPAYFYTRLLARMQNGLEEKKQPTMLLRPAFLAASLSIALIINIAFLFQFKKDESGPFPGQTNNPASIESFVTAYDLDAASVYQ